MASVKLEMTFVNITNDKVKLSIDSPREDITEAEIETAMDNIVLKNVFDTSGGKLVGNVGARIVTTDVEKFEFTAE